MRCPGARRQGPSAASRMAVPSRDSARSCRHWSLKAEVPWVGLPASTDQRMRSSRRPTTAAPERLAPGAARAHTEPVARCRSSAAVAAYYALRDDSPETALGSRRRLGCGNAVRTSLDFAAFPRRGDADAPTDPPEASRQVEPRAMGWQQPLVIGIRGGPAAGSPDLSLKLYWRKSAPKECDCAASGCLLHRQVPGLTPNLWRR